jgi:protein-tyrosine phosphatase
MVDIHSHILWGMDDGAFSVEESLQMLDIAADSGTTDIVATPHSDTKYSFDPELVDQRIAELKSMRPGGPRIHRGCDFHLMFSNIEDALSDPTKYTINGKSYLMVEFSDMAIFKSTDADLERLLAAGMLPVITHPERNPLLRQRLDQLQRWITSGCYLQVTAASYFGRFGPKAEKFAEELTQHDMVHFIASDAHDTEHRPPQLQQCYEYIAKKYGEDRAQRLLVTNPSMALEGTPLPAREAQPATGKRFWFLR